MKYWKKDPIVEEVRKNREEAARRQEADPEAYRRESLALAKKIGSRRSKLKPLKLDFSQLSKKAKRAR